MPRLPSGWMCGLAAVLDLGLKPVHALEGRLAAMGELVSHRGPDGEGSWLHPRGHVGFAHRRLSIIDLESGGQPMTDSGGNWLVHNGEIYNYLELRAALGADGFRTTSDTEVILAAYRRFGVDCLDHLRGMFAFALWDEDEQRLFVARDRFGIKPLYYAVVEGVFHCASEAKALLPFLSSVETDDEALRDYLTFQFVLGGKTLFKDVSELPAGHYLTVQGGTLRTRRYWEVHFEPDFDHTERYLVDRVAAAVESSVSLHTRADVPVGAYLSGGLDSSIVTSLAAGMLEPGMQAFTGRFGSGGRYDESAYARAVADERNLELHEIEIGPDDFASTIRSVVYHLDYPVAGPGSFPQFIVSRYAARHRKVVLGGQGGDEVFGGYARYLVAYFEQCIKAAIDGTMHNGNFVVTYESIIPNLATLSGYKPMLQEFWREGLFGSLDERYYRLLSRAPHLDGVIDWSVLGEYSPYETFLDIFRADNVRKESYFDSMTHFDFKTLLPALLQVEDRVSMAHGLESRVPLVDHEVVELAATLPADVKFRNGELKHSLRRALGHRIPQAVLSRQDKMGFPVPLTEWAQGTLRDFLLDVFRSGPATRPYLRPGFRAEDVIGAESAYGRSLWGLLCLELWQQEFHDRGAHWRAIGQRAAERAGAPLVG